MDVTRSGGAGAIAEWRSIFEPAAQNGSFQEQLQAVQASDAPSPARLPHTGNPLGSYPAGWEAGPAAGSGSRSSAPGRYAGANITYNGESVTFQQLPAKVQQQLLEQEESWAEAEAYRARVAADPNIGPAAKARPYDAALHEEAMIGLAMMDPAAAKMTPEQYYNYIGSDRAKYDALLREADAVPNRSLMAEAQRRIFGPDLEQESKVQMVRDFRAEGKQLPVSFAEFEQLWQSDTARQKALDEERRKLLES